VLRVHRGVVPTQHELWKKVSEELQKEEPPRRTGPARMRAVLATAKGVHLEVRYSQRGEDRPLVKCPVCFHEIKPRQNQTLWGEQVVVGYRCTSCPFWTPLKRRVPAQYTFRTEGAFS
jgi:hypothetical protein